MSESDNISIRLMCIDDHDAAVALWRQSDGVMVRGADRRDAIERYLKRNPTTSFVACDGDRLVGTILAGTDGRRGVVHHLAVAETHRRRGVARRLLDAALEALRSLGIEKCTTFVFRENAPAHGFWADAGWEHRDDLDVFTFVLSGDPNA